jgi:hypothetical protein
MNFSPTYLDYVNSLGRNPDMTEEQWNALSEADRWAVSGGAFQIRPNDPRYAELHGLTGGEGGRNIYLRSTPMGGDDILQGGEYHGENFFAHSEDAETPHFQASAEKPNWPVFALPLAFLGAGAFLGGGLGGAGAETAAGAGAR